MPRPRPRPRPAARPGRRRPLTVSSAAGTPSHAGSSPASGSRNGRLRCTGPGERVPAPRAAATASSATARSISALLGVAVGVGRLGNGQVGLEPHGRREHPGLAGGLVRADAAQLGRAVGGQQQQRHAGVMRLERGRQQVRDRGARRADHGRRHPCLAPDAERGEAGDALVDAHVQAERAAPLELGRDERERLRARTGAQDDVPDAQLDEPAQQRRGGVGGGRGVERALGAGRAGHGQPTAPRWPRVSSSPSAGRIGGFDCGGVPGVGAPPAAAVSGAVPPGAVVSSVPRDRPAGSTGVVVLGVELRELFLETADALVLIADRADAAEELGVVVRRATRGDGRARMRPTTSQRMPPRTGSRTTMSTHTGLLTPRWRFGGWTAQSTMVKTQNAVATRAMNQQHP